MQADLSNIIALYGGSFDPLHYAHMEIIRLLRENLLYKRIILMPNYRNPLKSSSFFTPLQRLQMCKILADEMNNAKSCNQKIPYISVSDYEVCQNRSVFSVQSAAFIKEQITKQDTNAQLVFVLGEDSFNNLKQWKDVEKLCKMVDFVLIKREISQKDSQISPHIVPYAHVIKCLDLPPSVAHFSSSSVRSLLQKGQIDEALNLVPVCLHTFIKANFRL